MKKIIFTFGTYCIAALMPCMAEVITDGTVGSALNVPLDGNNNFAIGQELGTLSGANLFHSFSQFNLTQGQIATFMGNDPAIQNVISRVTGGTSNIDGTIKSGIGTAMYFINPAGIVFGQNAKVDVPGAFYASTANELKFADGTKFSATNLQASSLSIAPPSAFGFLGTQTGELTLDGANLVFKDAVSVQLSANKITMNGTKIASEHKIPNSDGMDLQLVAVGNASQDVSINTLPENALGDITLKNATLNLSGNGGGRFSMRAGNINATDSTVTVTNSGGKNALPGQGVDINGSNIKLDNTSISTSALDGGDAGDIQVNAGMLQIDGKGSRASIASTANTGSDGRSGTVTVNVQKQLSVVNGGMIVSGTFAKGDTGNVNVQAATIKIDAQGSKNITGILSSAEKDKNGKDSSGKAGIVTVSAQNELILNGGQISSRTYAKGDAGNVDVKARSIWIEGQDAKVLTGIVSNANTGSSGKAGMVSINAQNELTVLNGGEISSSTFSKGDAGLVNVNAGSVLINGQESQKDTGIFSTTGKDRSGDDFGGKAGVVMVTAQNELAVTNGGLITSSTKGKGNAGSVTVSAQNQLTVANGGKISSDTSGVGDAGSVNVNAGTIRIDGQGSEEDTAIASRVTDSGSKGKAGTVTVDAKKELTMINGGVISSSTFGKGDAGAVDVKAGSILIDQQGSETNTGIFSNANKGSSGKAGTVRVAVQNELAVLNAGSISSVTSSSQNAGSVDVKAGTVIIDSKGAKGSDDATGIFSDAESGSAGNAGTVTVVAQDKLALFNGGKITSRTYAKGDAGKVNVQAGTIQIDGQGSEYTTGIFSDANTGSSGNAGTVTVSAQKELSVVNHGAISTNTYAKGNAGTVDIKAEKIQVGEQESDSLAYISSNANSNSSGNAGNVTVTAQDELIVGNNGVISSGTFGKGDAGTVEVKADTISISGQGSKIPGIFSNAYSGSSGKTGSVTVTASKALTLNQGQINIRSDVYATNLADIQQNKITVTAPQINLTNNSKIDAASTGNIPASAIQIYTDQLTVAGSSQITTTANQGNGGPISINTNDWLFLDNSQIATSVTGADNGNGGDITLDGDLLIMDSGFIQANTFAKAANGGNINLNIKQLVYSQDNLQRGGNTPLVFSPNSGLNVIQAASPDGVNGNINITGPQLNIIGALVGLNNPELDLSRVDQGPCSSNARRSTLKSLGKGGLPKLHNGKDGYTIDRLLDTAEASPTSQAGHAPAKLEECKPRQIQSSQSLAVAKG